MAKTKRAPSSTQAESREDMLVPAIQRARIEEMMPGPLVKGVRGPDVKVVHRHPIVQRGEWADPDDTNQRSKTPRPVLGYRRADPLRTMHIRGDLVTKEHMVAAERLRDDCELGHGARPGSERSEIRASGHAGGPGDAQLDALARYTAAVASAGFGTKSCEVMLWVVIHGGDASGWAEAHGISRHVVIGLLVAALDNLERHYQTTG